MSISLFKLAFTWGRTNFYYFFISIFIQATIIGFDFPFLFYGVDISCPYSFLVVSPYLFEKQHLFQSFLWKSTSTMSEKTTLIFCIMMVSFCLYFHFSFHFFNLFCWINLLFKSIYWNCSSCNQLTRNFFVIFSSFLKLNLRCLNFNFHFLAFLEN